jgi:hypothetical protein
MDPTNIGKYVLEAVGAGAATSVMYAVTQKVAPLSLYLQQLRSFAIFHVVGSLIIGYLAINYLTKIGGLSNLQSSPQYALVMVCIGTCIVCFLNILFWQGFIINTESTYFEHVLNLNDKNDKTTSRSYSGFLKKVIETRFLVDDRNNMIYNDEENENVFSLNIMFKNAPDFQRKTKELFDTTKKMRGVDVFDLFHKKMEESADIAGNFNFDILLMMAYRKYFTENIKFIILASATIVVYQTFFNTIIKILEKINDKCISSEYTKNWFQGVNWISILVILSFLFQPNRSKETTQIQLNDIVFYVGNEQQINDDQTYTIQLVKTGTLLMNIPSIQIQVFQPPNVYMSYASFLIFFSLFTFLLSGIYCQLYSFFPSIDLTQCIVWMVSLYIGGVLYLYDFILVRPFPHNKPTRFSFSILYQCVVVAAMCTLLYYSIRSKLSSTYSFSVFIFLLVLQYPIVLIASATPPTPIYSKFFTIFSLISIIYLSIALNISEKTETRNVFLRSILPSFFVLISISLYLFPKIYYYDKFQKFIQNYYPPRPKQISNSTKPSQQQRLLPASHPPLETTPPFTIVHPQTHPQPMTAVTQPPSSSPSHTSPPLSLSTSWSVPIHQLVTMISEEKLKVPSFSGNIPCQVVRPTINDESWWGVQYELELSCSNPGKQGDIMTLTMDKLKEEFQRLKKNQVGEKSYFLFAFYIMKNYVDILTKLTIPKLSGQSQQTQHDIFQPVSQKTLYWKDFVNYILFEHGILNQTSKKGHFHFSPVYDDGKIHHFKYSISEKGSSSSLMNKQDKQLYLSQDIKENEIDEICNNLIFEELLKMIQKPKSK